MMVQRIRAQARIFALALAATLAAGSAACGSTPAQTLSTPEDSAADAADGKKVFSQNCARCHGFNMTNPAPGVFDLRTFPTDDKPRFVTAVSEGKGAMPAWKAVLSPAEIESLWSYVSGAHSP